jgi:GTP-binding protein LepA
MKRNTIRNFCIIAHVDHGKSTLADRMLELTGTVDARDMKSQTLDQMDIEQERGITIKLAPVRMQWRQRGELGDAKVDDSGVHDEDFTLHLIDTPGHVDFTYEVSRALAAVEGAVLLVDATQGVQAQTIANCYLALEQNLAIIPALNKIDLPNADVARVRAEVVDLLGCDPDEILSVSGKTGEGVEALLDAIIARIPEPRESTVSVARATIFDSFYDDYRGVIGYVRVFDGQFRAGERVRLCATRAEVDVLEVGTFHPKLLPEDTLDCGTIGYVVTGLKDIRDVRVGDTIASARENVDPLPGYREPVPMVYAGIFPKYADDTQALRDAIQKLRLNDSSLQYEPEHSPALGMGFRCGFLGLLHLEVFRERLVREHRVDVVVTVPSVAYHVTNQHADADAKPLVIRSPQALPDPSQIERIDEPWVRLDIVTPESYVGGLMQLCQEYRAEYVTTEYIGNASAGRRAVLKYHLPLASVLVDYYDRLKSVSQGYASMSYELSDYQPANVRRLDVLVSGDVVDALATIVYVDTAHEVGKRIVQRLKEAIPRQNFQIRIQAALGGKIVASESISALRKDVTANLYGGDITRKRKLLERQKKGKKSMRASGKVDIPPAAYLAVLKR